MDAEIAYAVGAGLKYWAYDQYALTSDMSNAWKLHQSSVSANSINWCWNTDYGTFITNMADGGTVYVSNFKTANYEMVSTNRPLFFLMPTASLTASNTAPYITTLRSACSSAGVGSPYFVVMDGNATLSATEMTSLGADAIGAYAIGAGYDLGAGGTATPYSTLVSNAEALWTSQAATGKPVLPLVTTGWDRRPRIDRPVPWEVKNQLPWIGDLNYVQTATPAQIASHVSDLLTWMGANVSAVPANHALIYAWNEHDEGGWLCPTWTSSGPDHSRLDALAAVLT